MCVSVYVYACMCVYVCVHVCMRVHVHVCETIANKVGGGLDGRYKGSDTKIRMKEMFYSTTHSTHYIQLCGIGHQ